MTTFLAIFFIIKQLRLHYGTVNVCCYCVAVYNSAIMKQLLKKLINARSTSQYGELKAANVLADYFSAADIVSSVDIWQQNRANIAAQIKSSRTKPALLFVCVILTLCRQVSNYGSTSHSKLSNKTERYTAEARRI